MNFSFLPVNLSFTTGLSVKNSEGTRENYFSSPTKGSFIILHFQNQLFLCRENKRIKLRVAERRKDDLVCSGYENIKSNQEADAGDAPARISPNLPSPPALHPFPPSLPCSSSKEPLEHIFHFKWPVWQVTRQSDPLQ